MMFCPLCSQKSTEGGTTAPPQERALAAHYKEYGDIKAANRLVTCNLRLVVHIAREYQRQVYPHLFDLIQEGNLGLIEAVGKFDLYRGIRFPSYAVWWIRAYIIRYLFVGNQKEERP